MPLLSLAAGALVGATFVLLVWRDARGLACGGRGSRIAPPARVFVAAAMLAWIGTAAGPALPLAMLGFVLVRYPLVARLGGTDGRR